MSLESEFTADVLRKYEQSGWATAAPEEAVRQINYKPDLFLKKGDQHLIIEIKREGFIGSRATDVIRQFVEINKNWKFEVKIIPRDWEIRHIGLGQSDVDNRVEVADKLWLEGRENEAFLLYWTTIEVLLRCLLAIDMNRDVGSSALVREAYEEGVIIDAELRELQAALHIRNRLVHGLYFDKVPGGIEKLQELAGALSRRLRSGIEGAS